MIATYNYILRIRADPEIAMFGAAYLGRKKKTHAPNLYVIAQTGIRGWAKHLQQKKKSEL